MTWPRSSLQPAERKMLLVAGDATCLAAASVIAISRWSVWDPVRTFDGTDYILWVGLVPVWLAVAAVNRSYDLRVASIPVRIFKALLLTAAILLGLYVVVYFGVPRAALPRSVVLLHAAVALVGLGGWRLLYATLFARTRFRRRVLIVGAGDTGEAIATTLLTYGVPTFEVVGFLDEDPLVRGVTIAGVSVVGPTKGLADTALDLGVSEVVVATDDSGLRDEVLEDLLEVQELGIQVTPMPMMYEALTGRVPIEHLGSNWWEMLPFDHPQTRAVYSSAKRLLDLGIALPSLAIFGILLSFVAAAIKLDSSGPVFYCQRRVGKHGRPFMMLKLRTMIADAEADGRAVWAARRDPRVTRVGRLLRATMLDEIPQLWNVVKGEMSIVGPRPERPELVAELETKIPYYRLRHAAAPGMAGWSLLHEGYSGTAEKALTKLQYDLYYIKHQSLWLDLQIILRTLGRALTFRRSERKLEESGAVR